MVNSFDIGICLALIILCCIVTYTDFKYGKISNKIVIGYGSILTILNVINVFVSAEWSGYLINLSVVVIIAIILYAWHVWAGGDCKLMFLIALATPTAIYWEINNLKYTLWIIYAFIFSFGFVYVALENLLLAIKNKSIINKQEIIRELKKGIIRYIRVVIYLAALGHVYVLCIYPHIHIPVVIYTAICITFVFILNKIKILNSKWTVIVVAIADVLVSILTGNITINTTWHTYVIILLLMVLRAVSNKFNYEDIETSNVKRGMILSYETSVILQASRVKGLPCISDETLKSRLTEDEVVAIIRWKDSKYGQEHIRIVRKIPFAIFITIGLVCYFSIGSVFF